MNYLISFLEGIVTFISPCLLPMLPVYISYFTLQSTGNNKKATVINSIGFVLGFTFVFILLGTFAGIAGSFLKEYKTAVNIITGSIIILFGLNFMEVIHIPFISVNRQLKLKTNKAGFISSALFGMVFSIGWTPCVGAFLGSALMMAASSGESSKGLLMLLCYSIGLGIPFVISSVFISQLKSTFSFIKKHYRVINILSGGLLIVVGLMMATGLMGYYLSLLSF